jgi:hypothetical protein
VGPHPAGAVVLVRFPFSDLSKTKLRPAVVLADAGKDDRILCQVTSKPYGDARALNLEDADFATGSLRVTSYVPSRKTIYRQSGADRIRSWGAEARVLEAGCRFRRQSITRGPLIVSYWFWRIVNGTRRERCRSVYSVSRHRVQPEPTVPFSCHLKDATSRIEQQGEASISNSQRTATRAVGHLKAAFGIARQLQAKTAKTRC